MAVGYIHNQSSYFDVTVITFYRRPAGHRSFRAYTHSYWNLPSTSRRGKVLWIHWSTRKEPRQSDIEPQHTQPPNMVRHTGHDSVLLQGLRDHEREGIGLPCRPPRTRFFLQHRNHTHLLRPHVQNCRRKGVNKEDERQRFFVDWRRPAGNSRLQWWVVSKDGPVSRNQATDKTASTHTQMQEWQTATCTVAACRDLTNPVLITTRRWISARLWVGEDDLHKT